ncbi:FAD-dependent oxidoreductase [Actinokineospora sp. G85]|uniref:FAD-dependent oxidoreductase n=1 Tax=Actinokineospora sp. G85 TaxID=3406626 RepID=UPI003C731FCA
MRAVVIGGGMAGLLAARVLADHYAEVVVLDRDELGRGPGTGAGSRSRTTRTRCWRGGRSCWSRCSPASATSWSGAAPRAAISARWRGTGPRPGGRRAPPSA